MVRLLHGGNHDDPVGVTLEVLAQVSLGLLSPVDWSRQLILSLASLSRECLVYPFKVKAHIQIDSEMPDSFGFLP